MSACSLCLVLPQFTINDTFISTYKHDIYMAETRPLRKDVVSLIPKSRAVPATASPKKQTREEGAARECQSIRRLFGYCYEACKISSNDLLPAGGSVLFDRQHLYLRCDFDKIKDLFEKMEEELHLLEGQATAIAEWLKGNRIEIDLHLFTVLCAFSRAFHKEFKPEASRSQIRESEYSMGEVELGDAFKKGFAECAEISVVAQEFLQKKGINSKYFSGAVLWSSEAEFAEPHSFILIRYGTETYVFDPANPMQGPDGSVYPRISRTSSAFDAETSKKIKRFVTANNVITKQSAFYGVDDHCNIIPERDIV